MSTSDTNENTNPRHCVKTLGAALSMALAPIAPLVAAATLHAGEPPAPRRDFEVVALVDSLDFAKDFDIETPTGTVQVLEHVMLTHPTDIWWRDKGGGRMR